MIACQFDEEQVAGQIILQPNRSWTWRANAYFIGTLMLVSLMVASVLTVRGFWMVLPFTVLELSVLTGCLYYCVRRTHTMEVLKLTRERCVFERGINRPTQQFAFDRYFTRFFVNPPKYPWYSKSISLKCRDKELEVGQFLCDEDKDQLVRDLRSMIRRLEIASP